MAEWFEAFLSDAEISILGLEASVLPRATISTLAKISFQLQWDKIPTFEAGRHLAVAGSVTLLTTIFEKAFKEALAATADFATAHQMDPQTWRPFLQALRARALRAEMEPLKSYQRSIFVKRDIRIHLMHRVMRMRPGRRARKEALARKLTHDRSLRMVRAKTE